MTAKCPYKINVSVDGTLLFAFPSKSQVNEFYYLLNVTWPNTLGYLAEGGQTSSLVEQNLPCCYGRR